MVCFHIYIYNVQETNLYIIYKKLKMFYTNSKIYKTYILFNIFILIHTHIHTLTKLHTLFFLNI